MAVQKIKTASVTIHQALFLEPLALILTMRIYRVFCIFFAIYFCTPGGAPRLVRATDIHRITD